MRARGAEPASARAARECARGAQVVYAPFGSVPASRLALSWSGRQRHGGEKASKECTTGAPNESRFFFCSSRPAPLLGVRYDRIWPSLPFFGSGDVTGDDEHRFRLDPGEAISHSLHLGPLSNFANLANFWPHKKRKLHLPHSASRLSPDSSSQPFPPGTSPTRRWLAGRVCLPGEALQR